MMGWLYITIIVVLFIILIAASCSYDNLRDENKVNEMMLDLTGKELSQTEQELQKVKYEKDILLSKNSYYEQRESWRIERIKVLENSNDKIREHNSKLQEELDQLKVPVNRCCEDATRMPDYGLYKCECGSEEFTRLRGSEHSGIKGEIPYNENEYQCVRCGRLHTIKQKMYGTNIQLDRVIKKES